MKLFLDFGDSNDVGFGMDASTLPADLAGFDFGRTYIFGEASTWWGQMAPGVNTGTPNAPDAWGPGVAFAAAEHQADPDDTILIVHVAHGSTPLAAIDGLDWNPASRGEMFDIATETLARADAAFFAAQGQHLPAPEALLLTSGPNDAYDAGQAAAYGDNLAAFTAAARAQWGVGEIVLSRMNDDPAIPHNLDVRVAQWAYPQGDPQAVSFKTIGDDYVAGTPHLTGAGYEQLGHQFFDAWTF